MSWLLGWKRQQETFSEASKSEDSQVFLGYAALQNELKDARDIVQRLHLIEDKIPYIRNLNDTRILLNGLESIQTNSMNEEALKREVGKELARWKMHYEVLEDNQKNREFKREIQEKWCWWCCSIIIWIIYIIVCLLFVPYAYTYDENDEGRVIWQKVLQLTYAILLLGKLGNALVAYSFYRCKCEEKQHGQ